MSAPFTTASAAAWAVLDAARASTTKVSRKAVGFLGETALDPTPLSEKQGKWLVSLLDKAGLPPLQNDGGARE